MHILRVGLSMLLALATVACRPAVSPRGPSNEPMDCSNTMSTDRGTVIVVDAKLRNTPAGPSFSNSVSTADVPFEACGLEEQLQQIMSLRCDDGSRPFASMESAHQSRRGSTSNAGRCGNHVDIYDVLCPEKTYTIYTDLYICKASQVSSNAGRLTTIDEQGYSVSVPMKFDMQRTDWGVLLSHSQPAAIAVIGRVDDQTMEFPGTIAGVKQALGVTASGSITHTRTSLGVFQTQDGIWSAHGDVKIVTFRTPAKARTRAVVLVVPSDSPMHKLLTPLLPAMADSFVANDHKYIDLVAEDLKRSPAINVKVAVDKHDGVPYVFPAGWRVVMQSSNRYMAKIEGKRGMLSYIHARAQAGSASLETIARDHIALMSTFEHLIIRNARSNADQSFELLIETDKATWLAVTVRKYKGTVYIHGLTGRISAFKEQNGLVLLRTLAVTTESVMTVKD